MGPGITLSGTPLAYFITVTTYGSWLPGDARGWNVRRPRRRQGEPLPGHDRLHAANRRVMRVDEVVLTRQMRETVERAVRATCEDAGWTLIALAIRSNHIHALVASGVSAGQTLSRIKGSATRALRCAGQIAPARKVWTRQGSTRYLWTERAVVRAKHYVEAMQDDVRAVMPWSAV